LIFSGLASSVRNQGHSARSSKVAQHGSNARNPQHDGVVSCQRAEHTTNATATRRTVAAQYSADAASMGQSVKTQWDSSKKQHTADIAA